MKYSELRRQLAEANEKLKEEQRLRAQIVGSAPRHAIVEYRCKQVIDSMLYDRLADPTGLNKSIETQALRSMFTAMVREGLVTCVSRPNYYDSPLNPMQEMEFSMFVVKP